MVEELLSAGGPTLSAGSPALQGILPCLQGALPYRGFCPVCRDPCPAGAQSCAGAWHDRAGQEGRFSWTVQLVLVLVLVEPDSQARKVGGP